MLSTYCTATQWMEQLLLYLFGGIWQDSHSVSFMRVIQQVADSFWLKAVKKQSV